MISPSRKQKQIVWIAIALLTLLPYPTMTVPEWRIHFIDAKGRPFLNVPLEQTWQNYSIESKANRMNLHTDVQGYVLFPAHTKWAPMLVRVFHPVANVVSTGVHASFGPSSWIIPRCDLHESGNTSAVFTGTRLPDEVVLKYFDRSAIRATMPGTVHLPPECAAIEAQAKDAGA